MIARPARKRRGVGGPLLQKTWRTTSVVCIAATDAHHRPPSSSVAALEAQALAPLCFLAAGDAERVDALIDGYHSRPFDRSQREALLRLILLHCIGTAT